MAYNVALVVTLVMLLRLIFCLFNIIYYYYTVPYVITYCSRNFYAGTYASLVCESESSVIAN